MKWFKKMSDEKSFLQAIKEAGIGFEDVLGLLKKEGKIPDLKTQEEIAAEAAKAEKDKKDKKAKKKPKDEPEVPDAPSPPEEPEETELDKKFKELETKLAKKIEDGLKIPGKTPSEGKIVEGADLPDGVKPATITTNKFEVRV